MEQACSRRDLRGGAEFESKKKQKSIKPGTQETYINMVTS
jgi:hypothetical protein